MKKLLLSLFLSLLIFHPSYSEISLSSYTQNYNLIDDYIDMARLYTSSAEYEKALEYIDIIDKISPNNPKILYEKAIILKNYNQPILARNLMQEVAQLDPSYKDTYLYKEFFKDDLPGFYMPKSFDSEYYKTKGEEAYNEGKYEKALDYYVKAINIKRDVENYNNLGQAYIKVGKPKQAQKSFEEAINLDVKNPKTYINMAMYYGDIERDHKKQLHYLKYAIKINPDLAETYYLVGNLYYDKGMYETAAEYYRIATAKDDLSFNYLYALGLSLYMTQNYEEAYLVLEKTLNLELDNPKVYEYLAKSAIELRKYDEARSYIEREIIILPTPENYLELAKIMYLQGSYDEAIELLNTKVADSKNAERYNYLGLCYFQKNDFALALNNFNKAISISEKPIYLYNLAVCYSTAKDNAMVDIYVNKAKKAIASNPQDYIDLVKIYTDLNDIKGAIATLDKAIAAYPKERRLYKLKLNLLKKTGNTAEERLLSVKMNEVFPKESVYKGK